MDEPVASTNVHRTVGPSLSMPPSQFFGLACPISVTKSNVAIGQKVSTRYSPHKSVFNPRFPQLPLLFSSLHSTLQQSATNCLPCTATPLLYLSSSATPTPKAAVVSPSLPQCKHALPPRTFGSCRQQKSPKKQLCRDRRIC